MKKKILMRNAVAFVLALVLLINPMQVFAEELPTEAVYDMEKGGTQTFVIQDKDGNVGTVTVRELEGNSRLVDGEYEVGYDNTGVWLASFVVGVSSNKIYNAHSPYYICLIGEIKYPALSRPSTTQAIFAFMHKLASVSVSTGVDVKITNGDFVITRR